MSLTNNQPAIGGDIFYRGIVNKEIDLPFTSASVGDCYVVKETDAFYIYTGDKRWSQIDRETPAPYLPPYYVDLEAQKNIDKLNKLADHFKRCERV